MECQLHITQAAFTMESISWGVGALYNILARDRQSTSSIILPTFRTGQQATILSARAVVSSLGERHKVYFLIILCSSQSGLYETVTLPESHHPRLGVQRQALHPPFFVRIKVLSPAQHVPRLLYTTDPFQHFQPCSQMHGKDTTSMVMGKKHPSCPSCSAG